MKNIIYPNYEKSTLNIMATLLNYYDVASSYQSLSVIKEVLDKEYKNVVLLVFDGMGVDALEKNLKSTDFLNRHLKEELTAVAPSTTTAAMTAYYSG